MANFGQLAPASFSKKDDHTRRGKRKKKRDRHTSRRRSRATGTS